jgi:DNA modification methylase
MKNIKSTNKYLIDQDSIYYFKIDRIILPDDKSNRSKAIERLEFIKSNYRLPSYYVDNWTKVKLVGKKSQPETADGIFVSLEEGIYNINNKLNHLTGKEWTKFTCSWFIFNALKSDLNKEEEISENIKEHPATFSPTMVSSFIKFFTKEGDNVIDPFCGIGSTLEACERTNRIGFGLELNEKYFKIIKKRINKTKHVAYNVDSRRIDELNLPFFDFSISSPPYWKVLNRSTDGFKKTRLEKKLDYAYSENELDLGNIEEYEKFLEELSKIYEKLHKYMKIGSYTVIILKNIKIQGKIYPLAWDLAKKLSQLFTLKDERIWIQDQISLSPYGYPNSWASNVLHHYCLIFKKE